MRQSVWEYPRLRISWARALDRQAKKEDFLLHLLLILPQPRLSTIFFLHDLNAEFVTIISLTAGIPSSENERHKKATLHEIITVVPLIMYFFLHKKMQFSRPK